jgi:outer membrane protein OmpA-like peptidoglycan-associated protein
VQGHTDNVGSVEQNRYLSEERAKTVMQYLVSKGVDPGIMIAVGFGETRPVFANSTDYGRAQNRRVQLRRIPPPPKGPAVP